MNVAVQTALVTVITLIAAAVMNIVMLIAQTAGAVDGTGGVIIGQLIPATALTGTSTALVWVVKQIVGGKLVHRDPASDAEENRKALEASTKALNASTRIIEQLMHQRISDA